MAGQLAVKQLLAVLVDQRAVLGDERDLLANFREKGDSFYCARVSRRNRLAARNLRAAERLTLSGWRHSWQ